MSTSDPIAPDRLEALLRGEAGADGRERRIGALLDELTVGEIAPPAELRERVRSLTTAPPEAAPAPRRRPGLRLRRPRLRLAPVLGARRRGGRDRGRRRDADAHIVHAARGRAEPDGGRPAGAARRRVGGRQGASPRHQPQATAARGAAGQGGTPPRRCPTGSARRTTRPRSGSRSAASPSSRARPRACSTPCARSAAPS